MKVVVSLAFLATATAVQTGTFSEQEQATWLDRHNYFRTTGLPWSAGNMRRIGWDAALATRAASTASECSMTVDASVNVFQSSSTNSSSILDEAIQKWVVETSKTTLKTMPQPGANDLGIGAGIYNSYSQVVWATTTSVGCATASCSSGDMVVCEYSPAGNDGKSPWYVHDAQGSGCPVGTSTVNGLCVGEGDSGKDTTAQVPAGDLTYQVYPTYVADIKSILLEAARSGATTQAAAPTAGTSTGTGGATNATTSSSATTAPSTATAPTSTEIGNKKGSILTKAPAKTGTSTKQGLPTTSSTSGSTENSTPASKTGAKTPAGTPAPESPTTPTTQKTPSSSGDVSPGKVKASSDDGSKFTNQAATPSPESGKQTPATVAPTTESASQNTPPATDSGKSTTVSALTQSEKKGSGGVSAAGWAGMVVMAVVGIAAMGVVMSYRKNEKRQREIMRDGGIVVI